MSAPVATGTLYLVATPIGNLEDISARALRILAQVDLIAAEDTRVTRKLLAHFDLHTPLTSYHAHSSIGKDDALLGRLAQGQSVALVSDAGTPCVSDPGAELVASAIAAGVRVEPIPGPNAALAALVASGLPTGRFVFEGFPPRTNDRHGRLREICAHPMTVVLFESSPRLVSTLNDLANVAGHERRVCVGREITKKFETFVRGTLSEVIAHFRETPPRGECVVVLDGAPAPLASAPDVETQVVAALKRGLSTRDAAQEVAAATGQPRRAMYALALRLTSAEDR